MSNLGSPRPLAATFARAVSHAESINRRSLETAKAIDKLVQGGLPVTIEQSHQQAVSDAVARLSLRQTQMGQLRKQLNLVLKELHKVGQILRLVSAPGKAVPPAVGNVINLLHRRIRRHGGDRLTADMAGRVERLSDEIELLNQTIQREFRALSDIVYR